MKTINVLIGFVLIALQTTALSATGNSTNVKIPELIQIPAGDFVTGSDRAEREYAYQLDEFAYGHAITRSQKWYESEKPLRSVFEVEFSITRTPITNSQYAHYVKETGIPAPMVTETLWRSYGLIHPYSRVQKFIWKNAVPPESRHSHPVVLISYEDATNYAKWLSDKTNRSWQLPTEQQWEKAARGTKGNYFPWGNIYSASNLNSHDAGPFDTMPVDQFPSGLSPYGVTDLSGQVFEWTRKQTQNGRVIVKGGSWDDKGCGVCRAAARHSRPATLKHILIGFRLVIEGAS